MTHRTRRIGLLGISGMQPISHLLLAEVAMQAAGALTLTQRRTRRVATYRH
jgi:hypothetical protein